MAGPANEHTVNDNTSGVTTLIDTMTILPDELKSDVAFIFFDLEEAGLVGSKSFFKKHKNVMNNKLLVNFDCVSDGENILLVLNKKAVHYRTVNRFYHALISTQKKRGTCSCQFHLLRPSHCLLY